MSEIRHFLDQEPSLPRVEKILNSDPFIMVVHVIHVQGRPGRGETGNFLWVPGLWALKSHNRNKKIILILNTKNLKTSTIICIEGAGTPQICLGGPVPVFIVCSIHTYIHTCRYKLYLNMVGTISTRILTIYKRKKSEIST